ncbi:unnamed protein product, partial [Menidia menidia]
MAGTMIRDWVPSSFTTILRRAGERPGERLADRPGDRLRERGDEDLRRRGARSPARRLEETDEAQLERLYKPVFVLKPSSIKCSEGQTARFDLKIVIKEDGTQSLIIVPAVPKDSGEWTVVAQNRAGR